MLIVKGPRVGFKGIGVFGFRVWVLGVLGVPSAFEEFRIEVQGAGLFEGFW